MGRSGKSRHWSDGKGGFRAAACRFYAENLDAYLGTGPNGRRSTAEVLREMQKALSEYVRDAEVQSVEIPRAERTGQHPARKRLISSGDTSWSVPAQTGKRGDTSLGLSQDEPPKGGSVLAAQEDAPAAGAAARPAPRDGYETWKLMRSTKAGHRCIECEAEIELREWIHYNGRRGSDAEAVHVECDPLVLHMLKRPAKPHKPREPKPPAVSVSVEIRHPRAVDGEWIELQECRHKLALAEHRAQFEDAYSAGGESALWKLELPCPACQANAERYALDASRVHEQNVAEYQAALSALPEIERRYDEWQAEYNRLLDERG